METSTFTFAQRNMCVPRLPRSCLFSLGPFRRDTLAQQFGLPSVLLIYARSGRGQ